MQIQSGSLQSRHYAHGSRRLLFGIQPRRASEVRHTVSAGYVTASFVLGIRPGICSRPLHRARRSVADRAQPSASPSLSVVVLGDESGYALTDHQDAEASPLSRRCGAKAPAGLTLFGLPSGQDRGPFESGSPIVLGLISTAQTLMVIRGSTNWSSTRRNASAAARLWCARGSERPILPAARAQVNRSNLGYADAAQRYV